MEGRAPVGQRSPGRVCDAGDRERDLVPEPDRLPVGLPARDLPPRSAAYYYFARWRDDGTDQAIHDLLRWHAREKRGRRADPALVVLDTQSVHAAAASLNTAAPWAATAFLKP